MVIAWHSTEHLVLDRDGLLWRAVGNEEETPIRWLLLGPVAEGPDVPESLEREYAECLDLWLDRIDDRGEQLWDDFHRG